MNDTYDIRRAAEAWLNTFSLVPGSVIRKLAEHDEMLSIYDSDTLRLIASPTAECDTCDRPHEGDHTLADLVELYARGTPIACEHVDDNLGMDWRMRPPQYAFPCAWDRLFSPSDGCDQWWLREHADEVARLGFHVFESEDWGIVLGIDAAGFDFVEAYWVPLYELRGLRWHEAE